MATDKEKKTDPKEHTVVPKERDKEQFSPGEDPDYNAEEYATD